jgi:thiamine-monophosphate kinase
MMDLSDGLATDLPRLVAESGVGAIVHVDRLPIAPETRVVGSALAHDPLGWATGGGEDYELLVTCARGAFEGLSAGLPGAALTAVGEITTGRGVRWVDREGRETTVAAGFEHFSRA